MVRKCTKCGEEKNLTRGFHVNKQDRLGRHRWCKVCRIAHNTPQARLWAKTNHERHKANMVRAYYERKAKRDQKIQEQQ